jgi:hypothetical protein
LPQPSTAHAREIVAPILPTRDHPSLQRENDIEAPLPNQCVVVGGTYSACALHGESGDDAHFSMVQVAPCWQPMVHPPVGQFLMVQVAPVAHWITHGPERHVSITQVEPAVQWSMKHAI